MTRRTLPRLVVKRYIFLSTQGFGTSLTITSFWPVRWAPSPVLSLVHLWPTASHRSSQLLRVLLACVARAEGPVLRPTGKPKSGQVVHTQSIRKGLSPQPTGSGEHTVVVATNQYTTTRFHLGRCGQASPCRLMRKKSPTTTPT